MTSENWPARREDVSQPTPEERDWKDKIGNVVTDITKGVVFGAGILSVGAYFQYQQQVSNVSSLSVDAAKHIKDLDQLEVGINPFVFKSKRGDLQTITARLIDGETCELPYETYSTGLWKLQPIDDNKARLTVNLKTKKVDTGTCPPIAKPRRQ